MNWDQFVSLENIYLAWKNFSTGKRRKSDVMIFESNLENELCRIYSDLLSGNYQHTGYQQFIVFDPKKRLIHKAAVRDRVIHRLLYNELLPIFNKSWLSCSFSCRPEFGQHRSVDALEKAINRFTDNYSRLGWAVKCDIKKFFDNIDHDILYALLRRKIFDEKMLSLLKKIIDSFNNGENKGIPIGNLTSQIFGNVYMHELDKFVKFRLRKRFYFRYADDFVCLVDSEEEAKLFVDEVKRFLTFVLRLEMHPLKIIIRRIDLGIDWLGQILLPGYRVLRVSTKRRMMKKISMVASSNVESAKIVGMLASYSGLLKPVANKIVKTDIAQIVYFYQQLC